MSQYRVGQMVKFIIARAPLAQPYVGTPALIVAAEDGLKSYETDAFGFKYDVDCDLHIRFMDGFVIGCRVWQVEPLLGDGQGLSDYETVEDLLNDARCGALEEA